MSVVGVTFGIGVSATRPAAASAARAATRPRRRADGCERSYQTKPPTRTIARIAKVAICQAHRRLVAGPQRPEPRPRPRGSRPCREDPRDLGREVPAARQDLRDRSVGDGDSVAEEHHALSEPRGELDVVSGDEDRGAGLGDLREPRRELLLARPVHAAGGLVEEDEACPLTAAVAIARASRWRSPPESSPGWRSANDSRPTRRRAAAPAPRAARRRHVHEGGSRRGSG